MGRDRRRTSILTPPSITNLSVRRNNVSVTRIFSNFTILALSVLLCGAVSAQEFPNRSLHIIVPSNAGNSPDHVARIIADELAKVLGQSVIVENKPSADGIIA